MEAMKWGFQVQQRTIVKWRVSRIAEESDNNSHINLVQMYNTSQSR